MSKMTSIQSELGPMKALVKRMLERVADPNAPFSDHRPTCRCCLDAGWAPVYRAGKRHVTRCPAWKWTPDPTHPEGGKGECFGYQDWKIWETTNKQDLARAIWHALIYVDGDEEKFKVW